MTETQSLETFSMILGFVVGLGAYPVTVFIARVISRWWSRRQARHDTLRFSDSFRRWGERTKNRDQ